MSKAFPSVATLPGQYPPAPAVMRILSRFDRSQLHGFIAVAIELADAMDGDPDVEDDDPNEAVGDEQDASTREWHAIHPAHRRRAFPVGNEDDEDDDQDSAVDDRGCDGDEREGDTPYDDDAGIRGLCSHYGVDQSAPISETNPALV